MNIRLRILSYTLCTIFGLNAGELSFSAHAEPKDNHAAPQPSCAFHAQDAAAGRQGGLGGSQYDTTHVYVALADIDAVGTSFVATFGGHATPRSVPNVLPVPSRAETQAVFTPSGNLSVFAYQTPIPFPFGQERNGLSPISIRDSRRPVRPGPRSSSRRSRTPSDATR